MFQRSWIVILAVAMSTTAFAQDDDDLVPLGPITDKPKPKPKPKPRPVAPKPKPKPDDDDLAPIAPVAAKGDLLIKVNPAVPGAMLLVDGKEVGGLPLPPQTLPAGEHTVTVKRAGYAAFVKKVMITGGKNIDLEAKLTAVAAVLTVQSDVPGALVLLNGKSIGVAPLTDVEVPAGPAEVAVIKEGFHEETQKISFVAGKDYPIVVRFNQVATTDRPVETRLTPVASTQPGNPVTGVETGSEPVTTKWYFWVAVAAGVAAVTAGVVVGVNAGNQNQALTPAEICGEQGCDGCIGLSCLARPAVSF